MELPKNHTRLMELIGRLREGAIDEAAERELESLLEGDREAQAYYVESMELHAVLARQQGAIVEMVDDPCRLADDRALSSLSRRSRWFRASWATAVCASLVLGAFLGRWLTSSAEHIAPDYQIARHATDHELQEIATLSSSSGCRWDSDTAERHEGQRLTKGTLHLLEGVAVVHFDCDATLTLEGPAYLELADVNRATLRSGKAVFSGAGDLDAFTLETPLSKIQDEGTEYAVSIAPGGNVLEIHVFNGRVRCEPASDPDRPIHLDAGQARRFQGATGSEPIPLAASQFVRTPPVRSPPSNDLLVSESFAYDGERLVGQNGGLGWNGAWRKSKATDHEQADRLCPGEGLPWPGESSGPGDGVLLLSGEVGLERDLRKPIQMDRDAAYYLSFLARTKPDRRVRSRKSWAYVTLVDPGGARISIGPKSARGGPGLYHKGRIARTSRSLRDDATYLFVCKVLARREKPDRIFLRIYGSDELVDSVEPNTWSITTRPVDTDSVFSNLRLNTKNIETIELDSIRIGRTWSSVTSELSE